jgi:hypothetical protein
MLEQEVGNDHLERVKRQVIKKIDKYLNDKSSDSIRFPFKILDKSIKPPGLSFPAKRSRYTPTLTVERNEKGKYKMDLRCSDRKNEDYVYTLFISSDSLDNFFIAYVTGLAVPYSSLYSSLSWEQLNFFQTIFNQAIKFKRQQK